MITDRDWDNLKNRVVEVAPDERKLKNKLRLLERQLKTKGYQKSTNRNIYYAYMDAGLKPFPSACEATSARHAEVRANIKKIKLTLDLQND